MLLSLPACLVLTASVLVRPCPPEALEAPSAASVLWEPTLLMRVTPEASPLPSWTLLQPNSPKHTLDSFAIWTRNALFPGPHAPSPCLNVKIDLPFKADSHASWCPRGLTWILACWMRCSLHLEDPCSSHCLPHCVIWAFLSCSLEFRVETLSFAFLYFSTVPNMGVITS